MKVFSLRPARNWIVGAGIAALAIVSSANAAGVSAEQQQWLKTAERHEKAGWIYLHVEGDARARGFQHGYLLAKEIAECVRVTAAVWHHDSSMEWSWLVAHTKP